MNWFTDNPIANLRGPEFLLVYIGLIACVAIVMWHWLRSQDASHSLPPNPLPEEIDPMEIAYLRGRQPELARVLVLRLVQRGFLEVVQRKSPEVGRVASPPDERVLSVIEKDAYNQFIYPRDASTLLARVSNGPEFRKLCDAYDAKFQENQMIIPEAIRSARIPAAMVAILSVLIVGGYKLVVALHKGRTNIEFLVVLAVVSVIILVVISRAALPPNSHRGRDYLERLKLAFHRLQERFARPASRYMGSQEEINEQIWLMAGIFGMTALNGTTFDSYGSIYKRSKALSGSDSGTTSGCGSSCGSSSSCGGGGGCGDAVL